MFRLFTIISFRAFWMLALTLLLSACSSKIRTYEAPSIKEYHNANIEGYHNVRYWGDHTAHYAYDKSIIKQVSTNKNLHKRIDVLALSGGAEDGAYGAGFLKGWSDRGDRPEFFVVTGISTGAIIAPFAFLGPKYDDVIKKLYAETSPDQIYSISLIETLFGSSLADTSPLRETLSQVIDDAFVAELAIEAKKGRKLKIGTTNLDAQRPMVWEITEIASSGRSDAKDLIIDIILASSALPGAFPPVLIDVMIDGKRHQEVHVDGGVTRQIFVYPEDMDVQRLQLLVNIQPKKNMWLIRNTKIDADYIPVSLSLSDITERSISTLIKYQGRGDLINIFSLAKRDGFNVHITNVPKDFYAPMNEMFDLEYRKALYQVGYKKGRLRSSWDKILKF